MGMESLVCRSRNYALGSNAAFLGYRVRGRDFETQMVALNHESAGLRERAAKAELQVATLQKLAGPRMINAEAFRKALEGKPKAHVAIWYLPDTSDGWWFSFNLQAALLTLGWEADNPVPIPEPDPAAAEAIMRGTGQFVRAQPRAMVAGGQPWGVTVVGPDVQNSMDGTAFGALFNALGKSTDFGIYGGGSQFMPVPKGTLRVVVAAKPDPMLVAPAHNAPAKPPVASAP